MEELKSKTTEASAAEQKQNLCHSCKGINLAKAFESSLGTSATSIHGKKEFQNRSLAQVEKFSKDCEFCHFLKWAMPPSMRLPRPPCELHALPILPWFSRAASHVQHSPLGDVMWLQFLPSPSKSDTPDPVVNWEDMEDECSARGWVACRIQGDIPRMLHPKQVPLLVDIQLVQKWLKACMKYHPDTCSPLSYVVPDICLIDCETLEVIRPITRLSYLALSYVWDKSPEARSCLPVSESGRLFLPPLTSLSPTVRESIQVTKALEYRYIWIDKFCIIQSDPEVQKRQINNMHLVYQCADITIVAAAGKDERDGLPGINVPRKQQLSIQVGRFYMQRIPRDLKTIVDRAPWGSRGWTMQEHHFSRRRLVFHNEQIFFGCEKLNCCETLGGIELAQSDEDCAAYAQLMASDKQYNALPDIKLFDPEGNAGQSGNGALIDFYNLVWIYSRRDLTFPSDALRAFSGVQRAFATAAFPVYSICGIPVRLSDDNPPGQLDAEFSIALSWYQPPFAMRRAEFPSWTWVGWTNATRFPNPTARIEGHTCDISLEYTDGSLIALADALHEIQHVSQKTLPGVPDHRSTDTAQAKRESDEQRPKNTKDFSIPVALLFQAALITADHFSYEGSQTTCEGGQTTREWYSVVAFGLPLRLHVLNEIEPQEWLEGLTEGRLGCIFLGFGIKNWAGGNNIHLLMVEWHRGDCADALLVAHRIGVLIYGVDEEHIPEILRHVQAAEQRRVKLL